MDSDTESNYNSDNEIAIYESNNSYSHDSKLMDTPSLPSEKDMKDSYASNSNKVDEDCVTPNDSENKFNNKMLKTTNNFQNGDMGYQSFGSKSSMKHINKNDGSAFSTHIAKRKCTPITQNHINRSGNITNRNQYTPNDFQLFTSNTVNSSLQEFLEETKSIEEDLKKLKQISIQKNNHGNYPANSNPKFLVRNHTKLSKITNPSTQQRSLACSGKKSKVCRTADNSLERDAIANHFDSVIQHPNSHLYESLEFQDELLRTPQTYDENNSRNPYSKVNKSANLNQANTSNETIQRYEQMQNKCGRPPKPSSYNTAYQSYEMQNNFQSACSDCQSTKNELDKLKNQIMLQEKDKIIAELRMTVDKMKKQNAKLKKTNSDNINKIKVEEEIKREEILKDKSALQAEVQNLNSKYHLYKGKCKKLKDKCRIFDETIKLQTTKSFESKENDFCRQTNVNPMDTLNIITNECMNKSKEISFSTLDRREKPNKYKKICESLVDITNKYCKGRGKCENLPVTIDGLFKKNKLLYDHLHYLSSCIGIDFRYNSIEDIGQQILKLREKE